MLTQCFYEKNIGDKYAKRYEKKVKINDGQKRENEKRENEKGKS
jgi:hypothetical protein